MPPTPRPLPWYALLEAWIETALAGQGYPRPLRKRLALLLTGLTAGARATVSSLSATLAALTITPATEESVARRLLRLLEDPRLDPARLLPDLFRPLLPEILAEVLADPRGHGPLWLVLDETSQEDAVHLLVAGLYYHGIVLPLAVRLWPQNTPLAAGEYRQAVGQLLWEVYGLLPSPLRAHVLLLADRGYGHPWMVDLATSLGWDWVLRLSGQVCVHLPDGTEHALAQLTPRPGTTWGTGLYLADAEWQTSAAATVAVFKHAHWRQGQVVAQWLVGQAEPWLLLTNRPASPERLAEYAQRWAIERLFLSWKSHGWDLEAGRVRDAARLGRLVSALVLATWWRVAFALPEAVHQLTLVRRRAERRADRHRAPRQLRLPWEDAPLDARPRAAKFSLLTWGAKVIDQARTRGVLPPFCWRFPAWDAPTWSSQCQQAYHPAT